MNFTPPSFPLWCHPDRSLFLARSFPPFSAIPKSRRSSCRHTRAESVEGRKSKFVSVFVALSLALRSFGPPPSTCENAHRPCARPDPRTAVSDVGYLSQCSRTQSFQGHQRGRLRGPCASCNRRGLPSKEAEMGRARILVSVLLDRPRNEAVKQNLMYLGVQHPHLDIQRCN